MTTRRNAIGALAVALAMLLGIVGAEAQGSAAAGSGGDAATKPNAGSPLPGGGNTRDLTMPGQGGVADTGLGGSTDGSGNGATSGKPSSDTGAAGVPGTGMSVDQPAGQGIGGQGVSNGITSSGGKAGAGTGSSGAGAWGAGATGR